jgi:hypothetical protein
MNSFTQADEGIHTPGDHPKWQESVVILWFDEKAGVGGFQRLGQLPNQNRSNYWNGLLTTDGLRYVQDKHDIPLVEGDRGETSLGSDGQRFSFTPGGGTVEYSDDSTELHLEFEDFYPMCEVWERGSGGVVEQNTAANHYESSGRVRGTARLGDRRIPVDGLFHRDHSWGVREWDLIAGHRWIVGTAGPNLSFSAAVMLGDRDIVSGGFVVKDGERIQATDVDVVVRLEPDNITTRGAEVAWQLESGETLRIRSENVGGFVFSHGIWVLSDQLTRFHVVGDEDTTGMCLVETSTNHRLNNLPVTLAVGAALDRGFSQARGRIGLFEHLLNNPA